MQKNNMPGKLITIILFCIASFFTQAQSIDYPDTVKYIQLTIEHQQVEMAYMDVAAKQPNGQTILLLHGKNFNGYYWKNLISFLTANGYRVIVPDQVGWGRSGKPNIHYSFHLLAANTKQLLDSLHVSQTHVIGHSMGGMLAARFGLMYPERINKLIFEDPIGLEDYKTFVPYQPVEKQYEKELKATYESYKKYQESYYPVWKPEYEEYVSAQAEALTKPDFQQTAWANALTYQMIYEQPVVYEFKNIRLPVLIVIGDQDRTILGKNLLDKKVAAAHGRYPVLGKRMNEQIKNSILMEMKGVGHIPHIQVPQLFQRELLRFLRSGR
jgi:pimeloyl-ACP methyl ester carboxylesterase